MVPPANALSETVICGSVGKGKGLPMSKGQTNEVKRRFELPGYVLDQDLLNRVDQLAVRAVSDVATTGPEERSDEYSIKTLNRGISEFRSFEALVERLRETPHDVRSISLRHTLGKLAGIQVVFPNDSLIEIYGFGDSADFQFNIDRLCQVVREGAEEYSWPVRSLVFQRRTKKICSSALGALSFLLLAFVGLYIYASEFGVNIDPSLIPRGEEISRRVADAIKSGDINQKLNVLLTAQLKGFTNVADVLNLTRRSIVLCIAIIVMLLVVLLVRHFLERLYPRFFVLFGHNERVMNRLQTRRQIWGIAIVVGFLVNIAAGIVVAVMMR